MKKNLVKAAIVFVSMIAGVNVVTAQAIASGNKSEYLVDEVDNKILAFVMRPLTTMDPISPKALKNFTTSYKGATNESWIKTKDGFSVRFVLNSIKATAYYDSKGNWVGEIKYYQEDKMSKDTRRIVKSTYYDYKIVYTQEIETVESGGIPTYVVCLENENDIKIVRVGAGEMEIWKEFQKAN